MYQITNLFVRMKRKKSNSKSRTRVRAKLSDEDLNYVSETRENLIQHVKKLRFMDKEDIMSAITKHSAMVTEDVNERGGIVKNLELLMSTLDEVKRYESMVCSQLEKSQCASSIQLPNVDNDIGMLIQGMKRVSTEENVLQTQELTQKTFDADVTDSHRTMSANFDLMLLSGVDFDIGSVKHKNVSDMGEQKSKISKSEMSTMAVETQTCSKSERVVRKRRVKRLYGTRRQSRKKKLHGGSGINSQAPMCDSNVDSFSLGALTKSPDVTQLQNDDVAENNSKFTTTLRDPEPEDEVFNAFDHLAASMEERVKRASLKGERTGETEDRTEQLNDRKAIDFVTYKRSLKHQKLLEEFKNNLRISIMSLSSVTEAGQIQKSPTTRINPFYAD